MRLILGLLLSFVIAAAVGLGATFFSLTHGVAFGTYTIGSWTAWPKTGTQDIDPYARATFARSGALPLGLADGVGFIARTDDAGKALDGRCEVMLSGTTPLARFWTLTIYDTEGRLVANILKRYGFTSQEIVRKADGSFDISIAPRARSGNWLPTGGVEQYILVLRLYDTPVGVATRATRETLMPTITTRTCA
ncbi:MAG: DUF1214 domain-containing protein [Pseudorhodoplanes sp.]|nr:DUF1214 domain-containing protein [Pseudorhodoplanes sp.]